MAASTRRVSLRSRAGEVSARVDETDIAGVHVGSLVDMDVDALPGVPLPGQVGEVQGSAAGAFSLFP